MKAVLVTPAATVTLVGTVATALLLESATTAPPAGAGALKVTVPLELFPAITVAGLRASEERVVAGITLSTAEKLAACIVTGVEVVTKLVETVKLADVAPAATVTLAGTVATAGLLLESPIIVPPAGAATFSVTVPIEPAPPRTVVGLKLKEETDAEAGVSVSIVEQPEPP